jgi:hypothetical protein
MKLNNIWIREWGGGLVLFSLSVSIFPNKLQFFSSISPTTIQFLLMLLIWTDFMWNMDLYWICSNVCVSWPRDAFFSRNITHYTSNKTWPYRNIRFRIHFSWWYKRCPRIKMWLPVPLGRETSCFLWNGELLPYPFQYLYCLCSVHSLTELSGKLYGS